MRVVNLKLSRPLKITLATLPFLAVVIIYSIASDLRLAENPQDKALPAFETMGERFWQYATEPERRSGELRLWVDTLASLQRLGEAMGIATLIALVFGVAIGLIPHLRALFASFIDTVSFIPAIAILPVLLIAFPEGDTAKTALIVLGTAPIMLRSVAQSVAALPREMLVKAQTLGASSWTLTTRVVLPQILPPLIVSMRFGLAPAWIFLLSAEALAAQEGLGYRIFLVRRYFSMDVILTYVAWIALIAFLLDRILRLVSKRLFRWAHLEGEAL